MAEDEVAESKKRTKQTVREKTEQGATKTEKPHRIRKVFGTIFRPLQPVGRFLMRVGHWKPFHILGLILWPRYFRNSFRELKYVTWPSFRESRRLTTAVIVFATVFGIAIALVDYGLDKLFKKVILKQ